MSLTVIYSQPRSLSWVAGSQLKVTVQNRRMFSSACEYTKLRTNIKLSIERLKHIQEKKSENSKRNCRDIADLLKDNKADRARIKVQQIIRDNYRVEAMDIIQTYLELVNENFGLIRDSKTPDLSLEMPIATILWSNPRIRNEIKELDAVAQQLGRKFGANYVRKCCEEATTVDRKVMTKLNSIVPGENLIEMYLVEIAKSYNVDFTPNTHVICDINPDFDNNLIEFKPDASGGMPGMPSNFGVCSMPWPSTSVSEKPPYPTEFINEPKVPLSNPNEVLPLDTSKTNGDTAMPPPYDVSMCSGQNTVMPFNFAGPSFVPPQDGFAMLPPGGFAMMPSMNNGPSNPPDDEKVDFDTLAERFENLKKK
ncbi:IST1 like [Schistosoma japonicum]|nr:IST1 like [Schistosoma japonicum]